MTKKAITEELREMIFAAVRKEFPEAEIKPEDILLEHPASEEHGDYATNIALKLKANSKWLLAQSPLEVAERLVNRIAEQKDSRIKKIETAGPGFINFKLSPEWQWEQVKEIILAEENYGKSPDKQKKIVIELVSPNINKPLHVGHLRNAALGMSLAALYQASGWKVVRDEINNDRGLHIMKAAYGYLLYGRKNPAKQNGWRDLLGAWVAQPGLWKTPVDEGLKPDYFVGNYYVLGEKFLNENIKFAGEQLAEMLQAWEAEDKEIRRLWKVLGDWVHEGIDQTYKRLGVRHEKRWYESLLYQEGKKVILEGLENGVFEKLPDGAIRANLEKYGLPNKILIRSDGTAIYMTFDIALTKHKVEEYIADKYVWVVGSDQIDHFKRLFVIFEMLGLGKRENFFHLAYGMVRVPGGKMSSRLGNVVLADDLLDKVKEMTIKLMAERKIGGELSEEEKEKAAEAVSIGAVKYTILKVDPLLNLVFDLEKSISLEGDSGPYLQYAYTRAKSVLRKSQIPNTNSQIPRGDISNEEQSILRYLYRYPEVVEVAAKNYNPSIICNYLFSLAQRFNSFYNNQPILNPGNESLSDRRLQLTEATAIILKSGLNMLGIEAMEKM